jgi:hypothetical protein
MSSSIGAKRPTESRQLRLTGILNEVSFQRGLFVPSEKWI